MKFTIKHFDQINNTPAVHVAATAWAELIAAGHIDECIPFNWDHGAVVAYSEYKSSSSTPAAVGVITYFHYPHMKQLWISLGWVNPFVRGEGCYRAMWDRVVLQAQSVHAREIVGSTHVDNQVMLDVAANMGRRQRSITTTFEVPPVKTLRELGLMPGASGGASS